MPLASRPHNELVRYSSVSSFDGPSINLRSPQLKNRWGVDAAYVTLRRSDIVAILHRFASGEIDAVTVESWANKIESREDILFEPGHEEIVAAALHDLANPVLQGQLYVIAPEVLAMLNRRASAGNV